jgi:hypothetical protein
MSFHSKIASFLAVVTVLSSAAPALARSDSPSLDDSAALRFEGRITQAPGHDKIITFYTCNIDNLCHQYGQSRDLLQWEKMGRVQNREHYELYGAAALGVVGFAAGAGVLGFFALGAGGPGLIIGGGGGAVIGSGVGLAADSLSSEINAANPIYHLRRAEIVTDLVKNKDIVPVNRQNTEALDADLSATGAASSAQ